MRNDSDTDYDTLRRFVLTQLRDALTCYYSPTGVIETTVKSFSGDERSELEAHELLRDIKKIPGQRLLVMREPSFVTLPPEAYERAEPARPGSSRKRDGRSYVL